MMLAFTQRAGLRGLYVQIAEEKQAELCQALEVLPGPRQSRSEALQTFLRALLGALGSVTVFLLK